MEDLYVISDLHLGRGKNPRTRRYYTLENFFYDEDFARYCDYLCREAARTQESFKLILNGDTFDLLRIEADPTNQPNPQRSDVRTFYTPEEAVATVESILQGHPGFLHGIAQILYAGHHVIMLPGNHDLELQWQCVQNKVRAVLHETLLANYGEIGAQAAVEKLTFLPWFYHEPQRIWIEHGCQYDPENAFRYFLRPDIADPKGDPAPAALSEADLPLGNFFQRYLYNFFGHITFIVPSSRANLRYLRWLLLYHPHILLRVLFGHGPFVLQVIRRLSRPWHKERSELAAVHNQRLEALATESALHNKLLTIDALKATRADVEQAVRSFGWQLLRFLGASVLALMLAGSLWLMGFSMINTQAYGLGPKSLAFFFLNFLIFTSLSAAAIYGLVQRRTDVSPQHFRRAAQTINEVLDIPLVVFGHSHDEEMCNLKSQTANAAWYYNTGTWIAVFTHDVLLPRERVQYTFLRVKGQEAELLQWSPGRDRPMPVILQDELD